MQVRQGNIDEKELRLFSFYSDLNFVQVIQDAGTRVDVPVGQEIMDYGDYVKSVPLILSGRVKIMRADEDGREILLYHLNPGETCTMSFSCCIAHKRSEIRAIAEEDVTFIAVPVTSADQWMSKYPAWKNFIMKAYDDRMQELVRTIDSIAFKKMDERLLDYLRMKRAAAGTEAVQITHQEIANDLFASREAISRLLKKLEKEGHISLGRNEITFNLRN